MVNKVYIDNTKIETRDNSNNIKFSTDYKYLKTNSASNTLVSGFATSTLPHGNSTDDDISVALKTVGTASTIYCTNYGTISAPNAWEIQFWFDGSLELYQNYLIVQPLGLPYVVDNYVNADYCKVDYKSPTGSTWTEIGSYTLNAQHRVMLIQQQVVAEQTFVIAAVSYTNMTNHLNTHGTGYYRIRAVPGWSGYPNCLCVFPIYSQVKAATTINAEITP